MHIALPVFKHTYVLHVPRKPDSKIQFQCTFID